MIEPAYIEDNLNGLAGQEDEGSRSLLQSLPAAIYTCDARGRITFFNDAAVQLWGRRPVVGEDVWCGAWRIYRPDGTFVPHQDCPMGLAIRQGQSFDGEEIIIERPDGRRCSVLAYPAPIFDASGAVVGARNLLVDITANKRTQEQLRQSEERYHQLLQMLPVAVYTCEAPSGTITYFNEYAAQLWGRAPKVGDEYFCGSYKIFLPDGTPVPREACPMALAVQQGRAFRNVEAIVERPDGSRITALVNIDPIHDSRGRLVGAVNAFIDITEMRQAQEELTGLKDRMEAELADARLLQETSTTLIRKDQAEQLYEKLLDAAVAVMHAQFGSVQMVVEGPERGVELKLLAHRGFNERAAAFWDCVGIESSTTCGQALHNGQRVISPDLKADASMASSEDLEVSLDTGIRACQTTPLIARGGRLLGMISTHWDQPHRPAERQLRLLDVLARQMADLIERRQAEAAQGRLRRSWNRRPTRSSARTSMGSSRPGTRGPRNYSDTVKRKRSGGR
jgi:PAS domain S-box-containing protein